MKKTAKKILKYLVCSGIAAFIFQLFYNEVVVRNRERDDAIAEIKAEMEAHDATFEAYAATLEKIDKDIREIRTDIRNLNIENSAAFSGINKDIEYIMNYTGIELVIFTRERIPTTDNKDCFELGKLSWEPNKIIGVGAYNDQEYTPEELPEEPVVFIDESGGIKLYSYGRINENCEWDGNCLINIFEKGELSLVTEGYYEDGNMIRYKQAQLIHSEDNERNKWSISDRVRMGDYNEGTTTEYYADAVYQEKEEVESSKDMVSISDILSEVGEEMASFYKGRTSDGKYNDNTGEAYFVKYANDGTVITLYNGNFTDGVFNDTTGNAWEIARNEDIDEYIYYKGDFDMGKRNESKIKYHYTKEDVIAETGGIEYECKMSWK